jgi:uncharacterized membrane protein YhaH (DUF805 family)
MMFEPLKKYAQFSGRSRRKEYWLYILFTAAITFLTFYADVALGSGEGVLSLMLWLVLLVPGAAVIVRRLHDIDKSGWWALILVIPLIGTIVILVFMCLDGTSGDNRFGPDPKGRS